MYGGYPQRRPRMNKLSLSEWITARESAILEFKKSTAEKNGAIFGRNQHHTAHGGDDLPLRQPTVAHHRAPAVEQARVLVARQHFHEFGSGCRGDRFARSFMNHFFRC